MRDGDYVTITNRLEDLPHWFQLHPLEVHGPAAIYKMQRKLEAGYEPGEPADAPNLWRALAGDRLVWVGCERPDLKSVGGVLFLLEFRDNALVIGESGGQDPDPLVFGSLERDAKPEKKVLRQAAVAAVRRLGMPDVTPDLDERWTIG